MTARPSKLPAAAYEVIDLSDEVVDDSPTIRIGRNELEVLLAVATPAAAFRPDPVVATCRCCSIHYPESAWGRLDYVGIQGDGAGGHLQLRNCACGSTLAVEASPSPRDWRALPKTIPAPALDDEDGQ